MNFIKSHNTKVLVFIIGLFSANQLRIVGEIPLSCILCLPFVFKIWDRHIFKIKEIKYLYILLFLWLIGILFSNIVNYADSKSIIKELSNVILLVYFIPIAYWMFKQNTTYYVWFILGAGISGIISIYFLPSYDILYNVERTGSLEDTLELIKAWYYKPFFIALASLVYFMGYRWISILCIESIGIWSLFNNSRNSFLLLTLVAISLIIIGHVKESLIFERWKSFKKKSYILFILLIIGAILVTNAYEYLAVNEYLGERARSKYLTQKNSSILGLASGRGDFFWATYAITFKPFFGYGSSAIDDIGVGKKFQNLTVEPTLRDNFVFNKIPTHSYLMGSWVKSGILGVLFWFYILFLTMKLLRENFFKRPKFIACILLMSTNFIWEILFSPYTNSRCIMTAAFIVFCILSLREKKVILTLKK